MLHKGNVMVTGQNALSVTAEALGHPENFRSHYLIIRNDDAAIKVYVGYDSGVTASTGHVIGPGGSLVLEGYIGPVFMIAASGTPTVSWLVY